MCIEIGCKSVLDGRLRNHPNKGLKVKFRSAKNEKVLCVDDVV